LPLAASFEQGSTITLDWPTGTDSETVQAALLHEVQYSLDGGEWFALQDVPLTTLNASYLIPAAHVGTLQFRVRTIDDNTQHIDELSGLVEPGVSAWTLSDIHTVTAKPVPIPKPDTSVDLLPAAPTELDPVPVEQPANPIAPVDNNPQQPNEPSKPNDNNPSLPAPLEETAPVTDFLSNLLNDIFEDNVPVLTIGSTSVALVAPRGTAAWALVNLLLVIASLVLVLVTILKRIFGKRKDKEDEEDAYAETPEEEPREQKKRRLGWVAAAVVFTLLQVLLFLFTEDTRLLMALLDQWTFITLLLFVLALLTTTVALRRRKQEEAEETQTTRESE
jgi:NADH:ubiquinone oxidoreductase subunit 3 (subunit A)